MRTTKSETTLRSEFIRDKANLLHFLKRKLKNTKPGRRKKMRVLIDQTASQKFEDWANENNMRYDQA